MSPTDALQDLHTLMHRGVPIDFVPQGPLADRPVRRSAVLILFGALDAVPGEPSGSTGTVGPELDVLLTRRATGMRHHAGQIAFPGGGEEPGDADPVDTALREAFEETGLDPAGVEPLGLMPEIHIPVSNNLVTPVVGWWRSPTEVAADHTESVDVFRAPVTELLDPAARGMSVLSRRSASGRTVTHRGQAFKLAPRLGGHIVWGFTGILLATLFDELGWSVPWDESREFQVTP